MKRQRPRIDWVFYYMDFWKDVVGYEGIYQISNLGRVKSFQLGKERILKQNYNGKGYYIVKLCLSGFQKSKTVHQLVAESFLNHITKGRFVIVDHINNDKSDNRLENLQIITQRENTIKDFKQKKELTSKYIGVSWSKVSNKWQGSISINGKQKHLGYFKTEEQASIAYKNKLNKHYEQAK